MAGGFYFFHGAGRALAVGARAKTVFAALGSGTAARSAVEAGSMVFRRSIYAIRDIAAGEELTAANVELSDQDSVWRQRTSELLGKRARRAIARGTALSWEFVENRL